MAEFIKNIFKGTDVKTKTFINILERKHWHVPLPIKYCLLLTIQPSEVINKFNIYWAHSRWATFCRMCIIMVSLMVVHQCFGLICQIVSVNNPEHAYRCKSIIHFLSFVKGQDPRIQSLMICPKAKSTKQKAIPKQNCTSWAKQLMRHDNHLVIFLSVRQS